MVSINAHNSQDVFERLKNLSADIRLVGVVSLTSWDYETERAVLRDVSYNVWQQCLNKLRRYNFQDLVCPVTELRTIKSLDLSGPMSFRYICPGIVFEKETSGQTRIGTPKEAKDGGASTIILGRTVTELRTIQSLDFTGPNAFRYICPGIVFEKETSGQTRIGTPKEAKDGGASTIILGRTVTEAENPNEVLVKIKGSL